MKRNFIFNILLTLQCNFNCSYCYQKNFRSSSKISIDILRQVVNISKKLKQYKIFRKRFSSISFRLFGGEPLLEYNLIRYILENTENQISIVTNGFLLKEYIDLFTKFRNRLYLRISYDGFKSNRPHKKEVRDNIKLYIDKGFNVSINMVIDDFKYFNDNLYDVLSLTKDVFLSLDTNISENCEIPNIDLERINKKSFKCLAGHSMLTIDTNGDIIVCHNALTYNDKDTHYITNIFSKDVCIDILIATELFQYFYRECKDNGQCCACVNCNIDNFYLSKKQNYFDRYYDVYANKKLCSINKKILKYNRGQHA